MLNRSGRKIWQFLIVYTCLNLGYNPATSNAIEHFNSPAVQRHVSTRDRLSRDSLYSATPKRGDEGLSNLDRDHKDASLPRTASPPRVPQPKLLEVPLT